MEDTSDHKLALAGLRVMGDSLLISEWTAYFGIVPTYSGEKGMPKPTSSKRPLFHRSGIWCFDSNIDSNDLEPHLLNIIERLKLPRSDMAQKLRDSGLWSDMFCYWQNDEGDRVPFVSDATMQILKDCGIALEIDEYPQKVTVCENGVCQEMWL